MNDRRVVFSNKAPKPSVAFSQAIVSGGFVFAAQVGKDPDDSKPPEKTIEAQTRLCLNNLKAVLEEAGTDLAHVVKATCYLGDESYFNGFNSVYKEFFPDSPPSRIAIFPKMGEIFVEMEVMSRLP